MLTPFEIPPGVVKNDSPNAAKGRFVDADKVHFVGKFAEKWGGWKRWLDADSVMKGVSRGATSWTNAGGNRNASFGTHLKLYAVTGEDRLRDITPIRSSGTFGSDPFSVTEDSAVVTVTHNDHGADSGAFVIIANATAVGGITIEGEYQLTRIDSDTFTITHSTEATSTDTGGGDAATYSYQINPGVAGTILGFGWSAGVWNEGTWGTPRDSGTGVRIDLRYWSLEPYGNNLLASPTFGNLYLWEEATDQNAELVTNSPEARAMFVTGERFPFALGTTTPMTIQWPDQDDITDWAPSPSNSANIRTLGSGSKLMNGCAFADLLNLVWTDTTLYLFQYTGSEFIYEPRIVGRNCGLAAQGGYVVAKSIAFWVSGGEFYMFSGSVQPIPHSDDVTDFVFRDMNPEHIAKTYCVYNPRADTIMWGYVSRSSPNNEPDKYVEVSLDSYTWVTGTLDRTTGTIFRTSDGTLLLCDHEGRIQEHETGNDANGMPIDAYITFGLYALQSGEAIADIMGFVPDFQRQSGSISVEFVTKDRPNVEEIYDSAVTVIEEGEGIADIRVCGRHFSYTIRSNELGGDFRLGIQALELQSAGTRR